MNVKTRIWLLPISATVLFTIGILVMLGQSHRTTQTLGALGEVDYPFLVLSTEVGDRLERFKAELNAAASDGDASRLESARVQAQELKESIKRIEQLPGKSESAKQLSIQFDTFEQAGVLAVGIALGKAKGDAEAAAAAMKKSQQASEDQLKKMREEFRAALQTGLEQSQAGVRTGFFTMIFFAVVIVAGLQGGCWLLVNGLWQQLGGEPKLAAQLLKAVARGDLTMHIATAEKDRASLMHHLNHMQADLARVVGNVRHSAQGVEQASSMIAEDNQDLSQRTVEQSHALEKTSQALHALNEAVGKNVDNAQQGNELALHASSVAAKAGGVVGNVVDTMRGINSASNKMADIIGVIDSIAFQTNILALNAAVEAARAGDQGRGFAVVASEVRSLAGRSTEAAKEIKSLIAANVERVEQGASLVDQAGTTMNDVVDSIRQVTAIMGEINQASHAQASEVEQVGKAVSQLEKSTHQNANLVQHMAETASSMQSQAHELVTTVQSFKLSTPNTQSKKQRVGFKQTQELLLNL